MYYEPKYDDYKTFRAVITCLPEVLKELERTNQELRDIKRILIHMAELREKE